MATFHPWQTCSWATYATPTTLVTIGMEALAFLHDHTIHFTDLKTKSKLYYTVDNPNVGAGARNIAGHYSLPMFAYSETVMRPSIHIVRYPDFHKLFVFKSTNVVSYSSMLFSHHDLLIALSGFPDYTICIWNCRTGKFVAELSTGIKCSSFSMLCSSRTWPMIMQYSKFEKELIFWEMNYSAGTTKLHEISRVKLQKAHSLSTQFAACFLDDDVYVVNDFGVVFSVEVAQFHLLRQWGTTFANYGEPMAYQLHPHKHGLMIACVDSITYITKQRNLWTVEWVMVDKRIEIKKMVSNFLGDIYAADYNSSLYQLQIQNYGATLRDFSVTNYMVEDFTTLNGIKDENLLMLTRESNVRAVEILRNTKYSELNIPNGCCIASHNAMPYAVVGAKDGKLYFISYEKIRAPIIVHVAETDTCEVNGIRMLNSTLLMKDITNSYKQFFVDFKNETFEMLIPLPSTFDIQVLVFFLVDQDLSMAFFRYAQDDTTFIPYADNLVIGTWLHKERTVNRQVVPLPKKYRGITMLQVTNRNYVEFVGLPMDSFCLDFFVIKHCEKVYLMRSLHTIHMGYMSGVAGTRNILTFGISTLLMHFRQHKRSPKPYTICRKLFTSYSLRLIRDVVELYNSKYLVTLLESGCLKVSRLHSLADNLRESNELTIEEPIELESGPLYVIPCMVSISKKKEISQEARDLRASIDRQLAELATEVRALIDYDISVTGKTTGIYRKFCLNYNWLNQLNMEARKVCEVEYKSLMESIQDKSRIRDWIMDLLLGQTAKISVKVRAIFTGNSFENYSLEKVVKELAEFFDLYRFQDLEPEEEEELSEEVVQQKDTGAVVTFGAVDEPEPVAVEEVAVVKKKRKLYKVVGNVFEHMMAEEFLMQDIHLVTANQMYNEDIKFKVLLDGPLREEFNKLFDQVQQYKREIIDNILSTNKSLTHIYNDKNIMLRLLEMPTFTPPQLTIPTWMNDEVLERIMTVDDSEITAINRRAKKAIVSDQKRGRMLLWSIEFWINALNTMMDGVLEKLWEEEIKKTPPEPEFMSKRQPHEYTLEDQKLLRLYEETLRLLQEDRQKYLRILNVNERKTNDLKNNYIHKFNERCAEMAVLKLKYDFALKHFRVRLLGLKVTFYQRENFRHSISELSGETEKATEYISRYTKLFEFSEKSIADIKQDLENLNARDKLLERQFKGNFLPNVPAFTHELSKLFRRRPKMLQRSFQSALVCHEVAARLVHKSRSMFPLPIEVQEYFNNLQSLDDPHNAPNQMDPKYWEQFVRLRRQKIENELKIKGNSFHLADAQDRMNSFLTELNNLRSIKLHMVTEQEHVSAQYFNIVQNQNLEIVLPLGQVETNIGGSMKNLNNCILMSIDDINAVNDSIKKAGAKKLRTMQRLAVFRRQVIYREWEHKMYRANIDYLKYMLDVIEKCKVSAEFLQLLRNWKKVKEERTKLMKIGGIEQLIEQRVTAYRKNLDRINEKISNCKEEIVEVKRKNVQINRAIDEVKVDVAMFTANRDFLLEEKLERERKESMEKIKRYSFLINEVRQDYAHILELKTILELQRLRTFPTLGPPPEGCEEPMN